MLDDQMSSNGSSSSVPIQMHVHSIAVADNEARPILILKDKENERTAPVWLTPPEAASMVSQTQAGRAQSAPEGLAYRLLQDLGAEVQSCYLTHVDGHYQYGHLVLQNYSDRGVLSARAGEMLPLINFLDRPIFVFPEFIQDSREIDAELMGAEKDIEMRHRENRMRKPFFH